ncbi:RDD family protein [Streptomyces mirabilis]|uniref:RDD family protein n=1 Tax=Streptomyces mirabilis TaxID=68239 RepID=UPI0033B73BA4
MEYVADLGAAAGEAGASGVGAGPLGRRIAAHLVDTVFASVFLAFIVVAASTEGVILLVLMPVGFMAGGLLYCVPTVHGWGTTIGKQIFGLRVVRLRSDGTLPPS